MARGSGKKGEAEEIGNLDRISMTWSQDWERKEKAVPTGRMELNMESGGVGKKREKEDKTKNQFSFQLHPAETSLFPRKASCNGGQQISHHPIASTRHKTRFNSS